MTNTAEFFIPILCFVAGFVYSSFPEWIVHRYVMHKVFLKFEYPFISHAVIHHGKFKADVTYELQNHSPEKQREDQVTIPMAWWNGPTLIAIASLPFIFMGIGSMSWFIVLCISLGIASYYGVYEYIHWCMHKPKNRWFEQTRLYRWINGHHKRHHEKMHRNFNVVLPLADLLLGTLYRAPKKECFKFPPWSKILF